MFLIRSDRYQYKYASEHSPRVKVLHGWTINVHHGATRQSTLRGDPCQVRRYVLSKTDKNAKRAWQLLKNAKESKMTEATALALLKPFSYVESDSRHCEQSVFALHVHGAKLE